ncbi:trace amine-associated receptor 1 [Diorhabda carinulata]|uniref:trace amine-associated receptor 1 n=1 Tax=Diorhabda carinulata TaxID=1163345 RepID=UPI0025A30A05|nr:trace amine-associated receptor 1 [Diorhabda carinulata]XP_057652218.1 trace amine-associated receptor 1 [Diorhabda carinulata]
MFHKMHQKATILVAPSLTNSSCTHPRYLQITFFSALTPGDVVQAVIVLFITIGVLGANMLLILVINSRKYSKYIHSQPRYLLTSLASNDFAMGLFVTPFAIIPSLRHCWPYGELVCQIQALLRGAISQQSAVILICMAMDRYLCMLYPARYHKHSSKKGCVALISMTWIMSVTLFSILVLPHSGFYFNSTGMVACEPFYNRASTRILVACGFYFPTTMILMYCYGSAFHVNKLRLKKTSRGDILTNNQLEHVTPSTHIEKLMTQERRLSTTASRTMAAMSLGFIVLVTPWTIQEVVAACTGTRAPPSLDFLATWLALSNSFWNPFLYWLLNNHFRRVSREILFNKFSCKSGPESKQRDCFQSFQHQPHCCSNMDGVSGHTQGCDFDGLSEKYWGEILERTLSSSSLHALQRTYVHPCMETCNGIQEMRVFDTTTPDL